MKKINLSAIASMATLPTQETFIQPEKDLTKMNAKWFLFNWPEAMTNHVLIEKSRRMLMPKSYNKIDFKPDQRRLSPTRGSLSRRIARNIAMYRGRYA